MRWGWAALALFVGGPAVAEMPVAYRVTGDAVVQSLTGQRGDPLRGRDIVQARETGNCVLCHAVPLTAAPMFGNLAPGLAGIAARLNEGQLRLRVIDQTRLNENTVMPAYYRIDGLNRVASAYRGKPILAAQQVEDVVAYLMTLRQ
ncbi:MAG: sulfur oxidation c-type cytochrome SoxX [Alphaproteobacteria bacterium]